VIDAQTPSLSNFRKISKQEATILKRGINLHLKNINAKTSTNIQTLLANVIMKKGSRIKKEKDKRNKQIEIIMDIADRGMIII